jgi:hypothetical protein
VLLLAFSEVLEDWVNREDLLVELSGKVWGVWLREDFLLEVFDVSSEEEQIVVISDQVKSNSLRASSDLLGGIVTMVCDTSAVVRLWSDVARELFVANHITE